MAALGEGHCPCPTALWSLPRRHRRISELCGRAEPGSGLRRLVAGRGAGSAPLAGRLAVEQLPSPPARPLLSGRVATYIYVDRASICRYILTLRLRTRLGTLWLS